jgi:surface carbohydrate biosynthesis protein (TIGR04326 family)
MDWSPDQGVHLFLLSGDSAAASGLEAAVRGKRPDARRLNAADLVQKAADRLRDSWRSWMADLETGLAAGPRLRDAFFDRTRGWSLWWVNPLAEASPLKWNLFIRMAQTEAVAALLERGGYDRLCVACSDRRQREAFRRLAVDAHCAFQTLDVTLSLGERLRLTLKTGGPFWLVLRALFFGGVFAGRIFRARRLGVPGTSDARTAFVTYFPAGASGPSGYRSPYFGAVSDFWRRSPGSVAWWAMYVPLGGAPFGEAVRAAGRLQAAGEPVYLIHQFGTWGGVFRAVAAWVHLLLRSIVWDRRLWGPTSPGRPWRPALTPLLAALWREGTWGWAGLEALLWEALFAEAFRRAPRLTEAVYPMEMHAWELAFNAAGRRFRPGLRTIGFQHASIGRHEWNYRRDPREMGNSPADLSAPIVAAANGSVPARLLSEGGFPRVVQVEAVRHFSIGRTSTRPRERAVLIAGSLDVGETGRLLEWTAAAFSSDADFEIWFKPHPGNVPPFRWAARVPAGLPAWRLRDEPLDELLLLARGVILGGTSAALEAVAAGCPVVIPVLPDVLYMNPLPDDGPWLRRVSDPAQLAAVVREFLVEMPPDAGRGLEFVKTYWNLDCDLPGWRSLAAEDDTTKGIPQ